MGAEGDDLPDLRHWKARAEEVYVRSIWAASNGDARKAAGMAICKINIDTDIRLAMTASIRKQLAEHPEEFDPRGYLKPARQAVKDMVQHKIKHVLGCSGKA